MGIAATWFSKRSRSGTARKLSDRPWWIAGSGITATAILVGVSAGLVALQPPAAEAASATSNWSVVPGPSPSANFTLNAMACTSSTDCTSVGFTSIGILTGLIESWNGTTWSVEFGPPVPGSDGNELDGVSCPSATDCVAVGFTWVWVPNDETNGALIETWDGSTWSVVPSPDPGYSNRLSSVSCTSSTNCVAAGSYSPESGQYSQPLIESWNGTAWSVVPTTDPGPSPGQGNVDLLGVSCSAVDSCVAVGTVYTTSAAQPLIEIWDGTSWSISPGAVEGAILQGVSCTGTNSCVAVGQSTPTNLTVIENWDGTGWSLARSPALGRRTPFAEDLTGVSCSDPSRCVAVGGFKAKSKSASETFIETWDGLTWTATLSPNPGGMYDSLSGVTCIPSSPFCATSGNSISSSGGFGNLFETNVPLTITVTSLPGGTAGQVYSATLSTVSGNAPCSWKLVGGTGRLPKGLSLNHLTGIIAGTPQETGTFPISIEALDTKTAYPPHIRQTAIRALSIAVSPP